MKYLENTMLTQLWDKIRRTFQTQTDNSLKTTSKTVVGAINELNGARKPIILTLNTTEVDEETYQKLLSDDVDVVFKTNDGDANLCILTYKYDDGDAWSFTFTCFSREGESLSATYFYGYEVRITKIGNPHPCEVIDNSIESQFSQILRNEGFTNRSFLSPVLQEIDLGGTDADRKAKLDKFETDWKALTGASDLRGARFVGITSNEYVGVFTWSEPEVSFVAVATWVQSPATIYLDRYSGQLTEVPLSSHLEPVEIFDDNSIESKKKNIDNIEAYKSNLEKLGVDTSISFQVPIYRKSNSGVEESGFLIYSNLPGVYKPYSGLFLRVDETSFNIFGISSTGEFIEQTYYLADINYSSLTTTSKKVIGAINEVNTLAKSKGNGTITEVKMNGVSKGTSGVVNLGTVLTEHQDISGKVDKTTLLNTLAVVDLSSTDIAVRKAALDDFKTKWLALGNTDLNGARFIGRFSDANGNTSIHESGKALIGEDTLLVYKQISPAFPTGFYGLSYIKDMANTLCRLYQIYVDYDTTDNPGNVEITQIRDSETLDLLNRFVYAEAPGTYLKIADAASTYLKKTAGEVKTANLADNAVTSAKLATGARKPIVITGDMTEVDEETYQKLLQKGTDVILSLEDNGSFIGLQGIFNMGDTLNLLFGYYQFDESDNGTIVTYTLTISTSAPHTITFAVTGTCNPVPKSELISVLQEIDLTGTDADRKAKLDQFAIDWKALTWGDDLTGARFVGKFVITGDVERNVTGIMTYSAGDTANEKNDDCFYGICNGYSFSKQKSQIAVKVSCKDGSLTITPLFSHLEAITIGDNTPEGKAATKAAIEAYRDNLIALGVDVTKGFMIPVKTNNGNGFILFDGTKGEGFIKVNNDCYGILIAANYAVTVNNLMSTSTSYGSLETTSKRVLLAINEVNALAKSKQDALTSGTNIKTINGQSLLGSGDIAISGGGGDVTAAGDNTFTGNNVFNGIAIADILDGTQYQITGDNGVLMFTSGATNEDIQLSGVATPTYSNSAANKSYVDTQISTALGTVLTQLQNI